MDKSSNGYRAQPYILLGIISLSIALLSYVYLALPNAEELLLIYFLHSLELVTGAGFLFMARDRSWSPLVKQGFLFHFGFTQIVALFVISGSLYKLLYSLICLISSFCIYFYLKKKKGDFSDLAIGFMMMASCLEPEEARWSCFLSFVFVLWGVFYSYYNKEFRGFQEVRLMGIHFLFALFSFYTQKSSPYYGDFFQFVTLLSGASIYLLLIKKYIPYRVVCILFCVHFCCTLTLSAYFPPQPEYQRVILDIFGIFPISFARAILLGVYFVELAFLLLLRFCAGHLTNQNLRGCLTVSIVLGLNFLSSTLTLPEWLRLQVDNPGFYLCYALLTLFILLFDPDEPAPTSISKGTR